MRKFLDFIFSRLVIVGLLILIQLLLLIVFIIALSDYFVILYGVLALVSLIVTLWIVNKDDNPSYKLAWVVPILLFPVFGGLFYLLFGVNSHGRKFTQRLRDKKEESQLIFESEIKKDVGKKIADKTVRLQSDYLAHWSGFPVYENTDTLYLSPGEAKFEELKAELQKAGHFIFLEYFIIEEGVMWNSILDILRHKAKAGVDVRIIYDDMGCLTTLPTGYHRTLEAMGIKCHVFNRFRPFMSVVMNNRDHRKIAVIDGKVGFVGGINLADEYINAVVKHGHWKDSAVKLTGDAVWSLTVMFLQLWETLSGENQALTDFRPEVHHPEKTEAEGYVQPYSDSPMDNERVGEMVYLNMINHARDYIYMTSPYLIVDNEIVTAMILAAKNGVDVRLITPHIGDKWYVHSVSRAYYAQLIKGGVKIYEYEPGFIHAKTFVADDEVATVGTINLDYRSLYLHFECGVWMYRAKAVLEVKEDILKTLERCICITPDSPLINVSIPQLLVRAMLRLLAPLM